MAVAGRGLADAVFGGGEVLGFAAAVGRGWRGLGRQRTRG